MRDDEKAGGLFAEAAHDHRQCIDRALAAAEEICARQGVRLTDLRRRVLGLVWNSHAPVGAYEVLDRLRQSQGRADPPTVYRTLDFLRAQGLVHRIESLNSYVGCSRPHRHHAGQFLICTACGNAAEMQDSRVDAAITRGAGVLGFRIAQKTVEVRGLCQGCQPGDSDHGP